MTGAVRILAGWALAAGVACSVWAEDGARAGESLWSGTPPAPATVPDDLGPRVTELEKSLAQLEADMGRSGRLRARPPLTRRLDDLEDRLGKMERRLDNVEQRLKRAESRKP